MKNRTAIPMLLLSLFLVGADSGEQGSDEKAKLLEQQKQLSGKIETLKQEQSYLLFQKMMCASDSKYLLINLAARTGQLKYKNRVLKDFRLTLVSGRASMPAPGAVTLTNKPENPSGKSRLVFGNTFVLQSRQTPISPIAGNIPRISLAKKDFLSIYYAVEAGAKAYILP
jgi:hypothetical protein